MPGRPRLLDALALREDQPKLVLGREVTWAHSMLYREGSRGGRANLLELG